MSFGDFTFSSNTFADTASLTVEQFITPLTVQTDAEYGSHQLNLRVRTLAANASEVFGLHNVAQDVIVQVASLQAGEMLGGPRLGWVIYQTNPVTGFPIGSVQTGEVFGAVTLKYNAIITLGPVQTGEQIGLHRFGRYIKPVSITAGSVGSHQLSFDKFIQPTQISSAESFGSINLAFLQFVLPVGITSFYSSGLPRLNLRIRVPPTGTGKAFGRPKLVPPGPPRTVQPVGITSAAALTIQPIARVRNHNIVRPFFVFGYGSEIQLSQGPVVVQVGPGFSVPSIQTGAQFGSPTLSGGGRISPLSLADGGLVGTPSVLSNVQYILPNTVGTNNRVAAKVIAVVRPVAISSVAVFGSHTVTVGTAKLTPGSLTGFAMGAPLLRPSNQIICSSLPGGGAVGTHKVYEAVVVPSLTDTATFGTPTLRSGRTLYVYSAQFSSGTCLGITPGDRLGIGQPTVIHV